MYFKDFDFEDFWDNSLYARKNYMMKSPSDSDIEEVESELGYKLPKSYIYLMKKHNGGIPTRSFFKIKKTTSLSKDGISIIGIMGIGWSQPFSLCGLFGSRFMVKEWGYPNIGVAICDCLSGHDMVFLDYRQCGYDGEPSVVYVDQDDDYKITFLADNFEEFVKALEEEP